MEKKTLSLVICALLIILTLMISSLLNDSTFHNGNFSLNSASAADSENESIYLFTGNRDNLPPVFGEPSPGNESIGNSISFIWSISISDPEGDVFNWSIHCDNGQTNSGSVASNGSKTLSLFELSYSTVYTVWVNATDSNGSGQYRREWYTFVTKGNLPPVFGSPSPANGSTGNPLSLTWSIPISDPDRDTFSWTIQCNNGNVSSGSGASNGTKNLILSDLDYSSTYKVWVNATDSGGSGQYTRSWYTFVTKGNVPPVFGTPSPMNGSTGNPLNFTWSIPINDPDGDFITWTIQCNGHTSNATGATNGTKTITLSNLAYLITYTVWVNATDSGGSGQYRREWYTFVTRGNLPPVFGSPSPANGSTGNPLSLTWSISISDPEGDTLSWTIECSNGQNSGATGVSNETASLLLSGLKNVTTYTVWVNATDPGGSGQYTRAWYTFVTQGNLPPILGTPSPKNNSIGNPLSLTWSIPISDPEGNAFSWSIQCNNGQVNSGSGALNGTKTLALTGLSYITTYTIWVNVTDSSGSGYYTRKWYIFTTKNINGAPPPSPPSEPPIITLKANASAGEPYQGVINEDITFDGSNSIVINGTISSWFWTFGDNTNALGKIVNHSYSKAGIYTVILTIQEKGGTTSSDTTVCIIKQQNKPPETPVITGPTIGTKHTLYTFTAFSADPDNDAIQYTFNWSDSAFQSSGFVPNATNYSVNHSWAAAGRYIVTVTVSDNRLTSSSKITVYIDAMQTRGVGYLLDNNGDGIYDAFYSDETHQTTSIQKKGDSYLIDSNGDGNWDYVYNTTKGITDYRQPPSVPGFEVILMIGAIALVLLFRRKSKREH